MEEVKKMIQFDGAHLELVSEENNKKFMTFLKDHVTPDKILDKSLGFNFDEEMKIFFTKLFSKSLTLLLVSDKTGEIIACRGMIIGKKGEPLDLDHVKNEQLLATITFLNHKNEEMDVYKRFGVDTAVELLSLGTHRLYRQRGIANKMMEAALLFCEGLGLRCLKGECSSIYSQKIYEKLGFETLHTFNYDEYKINDEIVFKNTGIHKCTKIYVKQLK